MPEPSSQSDAGQDDALALTQRQCASSVDKEGDENVLRINCMGCPYGSSIEDSEVCMTRVIYKLLEYDSISRIQLIARRIYEYDEVQTGLLQEIANVIKFIRTSRDLFSLYGMVNGECVKCTPDRFRFIQSLIIDLLPRDPVGAYVELVRRIRHDEILADREGSAECKSCTLHYTRNVLGKIKELLDGCKLIQAAQPSLEGLREGDRRIYVGIFRPSIRPNFTFTKLMARLPYAVESVRSYKVGSSDINIFRVPEKVIPLYHILPPEFKLTEEQFKIVDEAREVMIRHKPTTSELIEPDRVRASFYGIAFDLVRGLALKHNYLIKGPEIELLAEILTRETAGFGILETMLADEEIEDLVVNAPAGSSPIYVHHNEFEDCETNVIATKEEVESWAARLRLWSGRPLDQSNPVLDTAIRVPGARARVAAIINPLSPSGLAFSFRRHRDKPWTLPIFIKKKMLSPLGAGLIWFFIDGARTLLFAGTRGSGKTSLLGASMVDIMRKHRIVTVEDTLELPVQSLAKLGYNIQSMKVQSAIAQTGTELSASDGIRTSLRLGDSCLIIGEVRSKEAVALYEAMRVGALANVVAGTIHGESPYGVYDRVVNDLGVPPTSFKATDIIIMCNPIRTASGLSQQRRVLSITEVRKHWETDPVREKGFLTLMEYNAKKDLLEPTSALIDGESEIINSIAGRVKEWVGNFDAVWDNIMIRSRVSEALANFAESSGNDNIIEASFVVRANDQFHNITNEITHEVGAPDNERIFERWSEWVKACIRDEKV